MIRDAEVHVDDARSMIKRLTHTNFTDHFHGEYLRALVMAAREVAQFALSYITDEDRSTLRGKYAGYAAALDQVLMITSPELMASKNYVGHDATIAILWCLATGQGGEEPQLDEGHIAFSLGDLDGAASCSKCGKEAWTIYVTPEEYNAMPYKQGMSGALPYVLRHGLGEARCKDHRPE